MHRQREGQIAKTLNVAQNLAVKEKTWLVLREEGMVVEEAADDDEDDDGDSSTRVSGEDEKVYDEKAALGIVDTVSISPPGGKEGRGVIRDGDIGDLHGPTVWSGDQV